jgi:DNA-directed RNA polymerase alpha subunit
MNSSVIVTNMRHLIAIQSFKICKLDLDDKKYNCLKSIPIPSIKDLGSHHSVTIQFTDGILKKYVHRYIHEFIRFKYYRGDNHSSVVLCPNASPDVVSITKLPSSKWYII